MCCIFTKLSQIMCLINIHILIYQYARCDWKLWNISWLCCVFCKFSDIINNNSCLNCYIFTKLSQTVCLIHTYNLVCRYARCDCRLWKIIWFKCILGNFRILFHILNVISSLNFHIIMPYVIVCYGRQTCSKKQTFITTHGKMSVYI